MKKLWIFSLFLFSGFYFSQHVLLTEIKNTSNNADAFLYALESEPDPSAKYLGKIEVSGFSQDDQEVFSKIYKKAKSIGSNSYVLKSPENIEGKTPFNPQHYYLYLYDTAPEKMTPPENVVYLINSEKERALKLNHQKIKMPSRSFIKYKLPKEELTEISVGKFLGSRVKFQYKEEQAAQYFQLKGKTLAANAPASPGIHFKTGDIIKLEKSFALFLISIYQEN